jgi:hypothetical protein
MKERGNRCSRNYTYTSGTVSRKNLRTSNCLILDWRATLQSSRPSRWSSSQKASSGWSGCTNFGYIRQTTFRIGSVDNRDPTCCPCNSVMAFTSVPWFQIVLFVFSFACVNGQVVWETKEICNSDVILFACFWKRWPVLPCDWWWVIVFLSTSQRRM